MQLRSRPEPDPTSSACQVMVKHLRKNWQVACDCGLELRYPTYTKAIASAKGHRRGAHADLGSITDDRGRQF